MRLRALAVVTTSAAALLGVGAGTANAAGLYDGVCGDYDAVCLYWDSNQQGSVYDSDSYAWDLAGTKFIGAGAGQGQLVKNNAASARNNTDCWLKVYYDEGYSGAVDWIAPHSAANLHYTWNNEASYTATC